MSSHYCSFCQSHMHDTVKCDKCGTITAPATGTEASVIADISKRQQLGIKKYGITVAANPLEFKAWLQHAYEECLDQAVYLKRAIEELEK